VMRYAYLDILTDRRSTKTATLDYFRDVVTTLGMRHLERTAEVMSAAKGSQFIDNLGRGNKAIFEDLFWQHLAASYCGTGQVIGLQTERLKHTTDSHHREQIQSAIRAWKLVHDGAAGKPPNHKAVAAGNLLLLQIEQRDVLQPLLYDGTLAGVAGRLFNDLPHMPVANEDFHFPTFAAYADAHDLPANFSSYDSRWPYVRDGITAFIGFADAHPRDLLESDMVSIIYDSKKFVDGATRIFASD